jgi:two-component system sensor histidine kinase PilS (NtrC family)
MFLPLRDPRHLLRWGYVMRLSLGGAMVVAVLAGWSVAADTEVALAMGAGVAAAIMSAGAAWWTELLRKPVTPTFLYGQSAFDLLLITTVVHLTGGTDSPFAALYILVIAGGALLLPARGALLVTSLAVVLHLGATTLHPSARLEDPTIWLQLGVFVLTAIGVGIISTKLREAGAGRERLVAELERARLQAADVLQNIRSGIITVDEGGVLRFANPTASALLGMELEGEIGRPVLERIREISPTLARALSRAIELGLRTTRAEGTVKNAERAFPVGVTTTLSEVTGPDGGVVATAIFQDLSDSKRLEALQIRAQRLEAIAALSASLAHEIKNPLASIRSATEQLARMAGGNEDEQVLAGLITRESDRLSRLLSEFLDFARVRVKRVESVDLGAVARGAAQLVAAHPDRKPRLEVHCATPGRPVVIEGDEDLLHRAIFNLALNAVQASPEGGRVQLEVSSLEPEDLPQAVSAGVEFENGGAALRVTDEGPGIPSEVRDRLFEPFITTKQGGTGLGLPVVHRAIEAHRGLVFVDSDGHGTRFTVLLPNSQPVMGSGDEA